MKNLQLPAIALSMLILVLLSALSCGSKKTGNDRFGWEGTDPKKVPSEITLGETDTVIVASFLVSESGITLTNAHITFGTVSEHIIKDRAINMALLDSGKQTLFELSVENPREIRTTGSSKPESALLPQASFHVALPYLPASRLLAIKIIEGTKAGYATEIPLDITKVEWQKI